MSFGAIGSVGNGIAQPVSFIIFGKLIEKFISFAAIENQRNSTQTTNTINLESEMKKFAIYYVILAVAMFVCAFAQAGFWSMSALRQIHRIRKKFYHSILKQDIGWFDLNESGGLQSRLTE